jgi:hypothetical protein
MEFEEGFQTKVRVACLVFQQGRVCCVTKVDAVGSGGEFPDRDACHVCCVITGDDIGSQSHIIHLLSPIRWESAAHAFREGRSSVWPLHAAFCGVPSCCSWTRQPRP